ncbi:MAG: hypothetical protein IPJ65_24790 [Archangiaceae bacterium]|nr:hypothetical protein [Archangiaceae bacterium]
MQVAPARAQAPRTPPGNDPPTPVVLPRPGGDPVTPGGPEPTSSPAQPAPAAEPVERPFTIIVAGGSAGDGLTPALEALKQRLAGADPEHTTVIFTGNYMKGELPEPGAPDRAAEEKAALAHVEVVRDFFEAGGHVYFLAGHRDFPDAKSARRLRKLFDRALVGTPDEDEAVEDGRKKGERQVDVMPLAACGDRVELELNKNIGILLVNSQWFMRDFSGDPSINEGCVSRTRKAFIGNVMDTMRDYRNRRLIVAMHHPLRSYGELGGAFTARAHLEPLPVVGSLAVLARQAGMVSQYQNYPLVHGYTEAVFAQAQTNGQYVFVSGHEAALEYLTLKQQTQVIAGTTAREGGRVTDTRENDFAVGQPGWAELQLEKSGEGQVQLFSAQGAALFTTALPHVPELPGTDQAEADAPPVPSGPVDATFSKKPVWKLPGAVRFFTGSFYSQAFNLQLTYPVLDLEREGLTPYKVGGGQQSDSIRARGEDGSDFAIRSTTKASDRLLGYPMNQIGALGRVLDYGFTATHPEAALAVPTLADAVGVLNVRPRLMYLPDQAALGSYRGFITDQVVLLEQRPKKMNDGVAPPAYLGGRDEHTAFKTFDEMVEKTLDKPWKHRVDQESMLRARLLDMFIGDWDRHRGQWRFAVNADDGGHKLYTPIAMDRDQAFAHYDGALLVVLRLLQPQARLVQPFNGSYGPLRYLNFNARDVDPVVLNRLDHARWIEVARAEQAALTDAVIDQAFESWHRESLALDGERIKAALKERRDHLLEVAEEAYRRLARNVDVTGSGADDVFALTFSDDGKVRVTVHAAKKGDGEAYFDRTFDPTETDELRLYGLEGDDRLEVHGKPHAQLTIRFVGGEGDDVVAAADGARVDAGSIVLYDQPKGAVIDPSIAVLDERSTDARLNQYEPYENHEPDAWAVMPGFLVNSDQGVSLGGTYTHNVEGYKKYPFAVQHFGSAYFSTATLGVALDYRLILPESIGRVGQELDLTLHTPQFTRNFYGYTNRWAGYGQPNDYWRVRQALYEARWGLQFGSRHARVGAQLLGQVIDTDHTAGRFVTLSSDVSPDAFGARAFAGTRLFAEANTFDSMTLPRRGVALHGSMIARFDVLHGGGFSTNHRIAAAAAIPIDREARFVILTRAAVEGILGAHPFYFAPTLGSAQLRAYADQQFAGDLAFAHSTDLRIDVLRIESTLPGTLGVSLAVDHGRVFGRGIAGNDYHVDFGGGLWWCVVDLIGVSVTYYRGLDGAQRVAAEVGPLFSKLGF